MECWKWNKLDWLCAEAKKYRSNKCKFREKHCRPINLCIKTLLFLKKQWEKQSTAIPKSFLLWATLPSTLQVYPCSSANSFLRGCVWTVISNYLLQPEKPNTLEIGHWSRTSRPPPTHSQHCWDLPLSHVLESIHLHIFCHSSPGTISWGLGQNCEVTRYTLPSTTQVGMARETGSLAGVCLVV